MNPSTDPSLPKMERRDVLLWLAIFAGPLSWALHEQMSYMLTPTACAAGRHVLLHLVTLGTLLIAAAGAAIAWRRWKALPEGSMEKGETREKAETARARFMALAGMTICGAFALVILAAEVPNLVLGVCD
jgi:hypothetical protein